MRPPARAATGNFISGGKRFAALLAVAYALSAASRIFAQAPAAGPSLINDPDVLAQLQPAENQAYLLGRGDTVMITVQGRPELTGKQVVGPDGDITMPLGGSVAVVDKTREDAAKSIRESLLAYYTDPVVTVGVDTYGSNRILLVGSVERPGVQIFDRPPTLLEVLARGGGTRSESLGGGIGGVGGGVGGGKALPDEVVVYRGGQTAITVKVKGLLRSGAGVANLRLQRDDVVYVASSNAHFISIMGQVQRPGSLPLDDESTLPRLLAQAGGPNNLAGRNPEIRLIHPSTGMSQTIAFKDLLKPSATEIKLSSGDIVYVPMSGFNGATYVLERLSPVVSIFTTATLLNGR